MDSDSWYAAGTPGAALVTTASHRYVFVASTNRLLVANTGPAFASRIFKSSSESVLPRSTAGTVRSPDFFASLHSARKTRNASFSSVFLAHSTALVPSPTLCRGVVVPLLETFDFGVAGSESSSNSRAVTSLSTRRSSTHPSSGSTAPTATPTAVIPALVSAMALFKRPCTYPATFSNESSPALPPPDCLLSTSATTIGGGSVDGSSVSSR
mmetsp:Transcript_3092/g.8266  ORF Transcript_3092/g.8266 Transcript_3092/m.8266 type:complete len:211 (-) Transcript_3092:449-1081(-)